MLAYLGIFFAGVVSGVMVLMVGIRMWGGV